MKLLTAVNLMLPKLGEHPVTSLEINHPTLAIILPEVENELALTLNKGWWFNEYEYTAFPDNDGKIVLGADTLMFTPMPTEPLALLRGLDLFDPVNQTYVWTKPIKGIVRSNVEFDLLPESAAQYIWYSALVNIYVTDIGFTQEVQVWGAKAKNSLTDMLAEHCRQRRFSTRHSRRFRKLQASLRA